jgi:hypothetical protein
MMTDIALAFFIGFLVGLVMRREDKDIAEQKRIYDDKLKEYESNIKYYKNLCGWHAKRYEQAANLGTAYAIRMGIAEGHTTTAISDAIRDLKGE